MSWSTMKYSPLLSLPPELVQAISNEVTLSEIKQLRLTCKALAMFLSDRMFRTLNFEVSRDNIAHDVHKIEILAGANHAACLAARVLSIGRLSHRHKYNHDRPTIRSVGPTPFPEDPPEVVLAEEKLTHCVFDGITSLKGVHSVNWKQNKRDNPAFHRIVMDALKNLPNLRHLKIAFTKAGIPLELDSLTGLEELVISTEGLTARPQGEILENVAKTIAQNPGITSIDISGIRRYGISTANKSQSLHQLFKYYPATAPRLHLRTLRLKSFLIRLDDVTLPHLTHLTSLGLEFIDDPFKTSNAYHVRYRHLLKERQRYGSSPEDLWKALHKARICLQKITANEVPSSFLGYLSSYSGLKELYLEPLDRVSSDAKAVRFFEGGLENHAQSLQTLQIITRFENSWCFGSHQFQTFSSLTGLKFLVMSIKVSNLDILGAHAHQNVPPSESKPDVIKDLLDMAIQHMPSIEHVEVRCANSDGALSFGGWNGVRRTAFLQRVLKVMVRSVGSYAAPPSCQQLPSLAIGGRTFVGERSLCDGTTSLRYVDRTPN